MKLDRILIPLDGSALAEVALAKAEELARGQSTTLVLLRVAEGRARSVEKETDAVREAEAYLSAVAARLAEHGVKNVAKSVWYGPSARAIIEAAQLMNVDVIVMSTHGRSGVRRLVLGSVAESVIRGTKTPVLMIRVPGAPVAAPRGRRARPAGDRKP